MADESRPGPRGKDVSSLFVHPWAYRLVAGTRAVVSGLWAGGLFLAAAWWWEARFNHARPSYVEIVSSSGWLRWWVGHEATLFLPAAIATVVFMIGLGIGRSPGNPAPTFAKRVDMAGRTALRAAVLYLAAILLAAVELAHSPGGLLACYVPFAVAIVFPWRWRRWRRKRNTRQASLRHSA